jgi:hypothetical protein
MRHYWLKIALGALAVFLVGMLGVTVVRRGMTHAKHFANSTDPIDIPIAFVPFKLNGERLGTINRIVLRRSSPKQISGADLGVSLADSVGPERLMQCIIVAERIDRINDKSTFRCADAVDTAGKELVGAGVLRVTAHGRSETIPYLAVRKELEDFRDHSPGGSSLADSLESRADSIAELRDAQADSIEAAAEAQANALSAAQEAKADSIRAAAERRANALRASVRRLRDSLQSAHQKRQKS